MNQLLFERATGSLGHPAFARLHCTQLLHGFRPAPQIRFDGGEKGTNITPSEAGRPAAAAAAAAAAVAAVARGAADNRDRWAHQAGVNALALERFDGRILLSGGADATIRVWDLEQAAAPSNSSGSTLYHPVAEISRAGNDSSGRPGDRRFSAAAISSLSSSSASPRRHQGHRFGITHLSFYPFDPAAFLSSSYDQTLKLWATDAPPRLAGAFDLGAKVYRHAVSPVADNHLLVACATQHPAVRLVDLRSGAAVQSLVAPGQVAGGVLAVAWSPRHAHVLASGAVDGTVRLWDVRRSGLVAVLDREAVRSPRWADPGVAATASVGGRRRGGDDNELVDGDNDADATPDARDERERKRRALNQAYRSLMGTQITFR
ncbi:WD repeat protein [Niveomyces insectorum RCEF 264]|uniref:WD repeat protein n=1 Tax=Niveomyces insectorum RCEF 264 TaxID=1081102 RepID=A0A167VB41_9HYPO|nr:WD repeat protein [Niveomyces insectorum RCEF 264]